MSPIETPFNLVAHFPLWLFYYTLSSLLSRPYPRPINPSRNPTSCAILVFSPDLRLKSIDPYNIVLHSRLLPRQSRLLSLSQFCGRHLELVRAYRLWFSILYSCLIWIKGNHQSLCLLISKRRSLRLLHLSTVHYTTSPHAPCVFDLW